MTSRVSRKPAGKRVRQIVRNPLRRRAQPDLNRGPPAFQRLQLVRIHRNIGGTEVDGLAVDCWIPASAADRLIVYRDVSVLLTVRIKCFREKRIDERGPGPGELGCR